MSSFSVDMRACRRHTGLRSKFAHRWLVSHPDDIVDIDIVPVDRVRPRIDITYPRKTGVINAEKIKE